MNNRGIYCPLNIDKPLNGIIDFLKTKKSINIKFEIRSSNGDESPFDFHIVAEKNKNDNVYWFSTNNDPNYTFIFSTQVMVTNYTIENGGTESKRNSYPTEFSLLGSNDGIIWDELDWESNDRFCEQGTCDTRKKISFSTKKQGYYSHIRLHGIDNSIYISEPALVMRSFELFGIIDFNFLFSCNCRKRLYISIPFIFSVLYE